MDDLSQHHQTVDQVVEVLHSCRSLLFITGAGISADSGLPTYRGVGGLYDVDTTEEGLPIEEILSGQMFSQSPALTWKYLLQIARACRGASFNRAHAVLAEMEQHFERVWVLTQNVDGFHRAAGSRNVIDIHGDLHEIRCTSCDFQTQVANDRDPDLPPRCPLCQAVLRPNVVLFGELLPTEKVEQLFRELRTGFDAVFSVGTSSVFEYVSSPIKLAKHAGRPTVEINPDTTGVSHLVDIRIPLRASIALQAMWQRFTASANQS
jgi:NAD-dependent deacetylase